MTSNLLWSFHRTKSCFKGYHTKLYLMRNHKQHFRLERYHQKWIMSFYSLFLRWVGWFYLWEICIWSLNLYYLALIVVVTIYYLFFYVTTLQTNQEFEASTRSNKWYPKRIWVLLIRIYKRSTLCLTPSQQISLEAHKLVAWILFCFHEIH